MISKEIKDYIVNSYKPEHKKSLEDLKMFLNQFQNPQDKINIIHVAGTNGKGSVCSMLNYILIEEKYSVGIFTSPHIEKYNERFKINNELISDSDLEYYINKIKVESEIFFGNEKDMFSFFQLLTIVAFLYFYDKGVDFLILETGIGGLFDSTNVIKKPIISVITSVSEDHTNILGTTLKEIAIQKAGIIKNNSPLVLSCQDKEVYNVIKECVFEKKSKMYSLCNDFELENISFSLRETTFSVKHKLFEYKNLKISLLGEFQLINASLVILAIVAIRDEGFCISDSSIYVGLLKARWAGRMEFKLLNNKEIIFDGAHNFDAAIKLKKSVDIYFKNKHKILVLGILSDKNFIEVSKVFSDFADIIIATKPENERALKANELAGLFQKERVFIIDDYKKAFDKALELCDDNTVIVVAGSLYLVGDLEKYFDELDCK